MDNSNMSSMGSHVNAPDASEEEIESSTHNKEEPTPGEEPGRGRPKAKEVSLDKRWADKVLADAENPWFAEANHTSGGVNVYNWNGTYLQFIGAEEGSALVARWLDRVAPQAANNARTKSAWLFGGQRLRTEKPMPQQNMRRNIVPCADVYLEIIRDPSTHKCSITALKKDPSHGMTYALKLAAGTEPGQAHRIKPLPPKSRFAQFLQRAQPDPKVRELIQEQCGLTLLPANYQIASWWVGVAGSGKSTLVEICKAMQRQVASISLSELSNQFGLEGLIGASLVQVDEVDVEKWSEGKFKSLVSCNGVSINRKNEKSLMDYSLRAKWIITSNDNPFVRDKSDGVWRRLCIVPWTVSVPEESREADYHLSLLESEGALILDWMLEGAMRLVERGRFLPENERPVVVQTVKEQSRNDCDTVRAWSSIFQVKLGDGWVTKDRVYAEYKSWCEAAHLEPLREVVFWKNLRGKVPGITNSNRRVDGAQTYFCNLAWTEPTPQTQAPPTKPKLAIVRPMFDPTEANPPAHQSGQKSAELDWNDPFAEYADPATPYGRLFEPASMKATA